MAPIKSSKKVIKSTGASPSKSMVDGEICIIDEPLSVCVEYDKSVFKGTNVLPAKFVRMNTLPSEYESFIKEKGYVPEDAEVWIPKGGHVRVDWISPGWFSIYEAAFRGGGCFPMSSLMTEFVKEVELMPFQILPSAWRIIHSVEFLSEKYDLGMQLIDIRNSYYLRGDGDGRIGFRRRGERLILANDKGDHKDWVNRFLFIKTETLGPEMAFLDYPLVEKGRALLFL